MDRNRLPPNQQLIKEERWPVVGEKSPRQDDAPWQLSIEGCVETPHRFALSELHAMDQTELVTDIHCVTRWSKFDQSFEGIPLLTLLALANPAPTAKFVSFVARSSVSHSTSLPLDWLKTCSALIALRANHCELETIHGGPIRMIVPGKYFYKSVKWLERIELLEDDRLGTWESDSGYHNDADPWLEQRYIAANVNKQLAQKLIDAKDFSNHDLLSLNASKRNLDQLNASQSLLRNANFVDSSLIEADFHGANLSNAQLMRADLRQAKFVDADLEGSDFRGADLRGANLTGASLFGASFTDEPTSDKNHEAIGPAIFDSTTRINQEQLNALTDWQKKFVWDQIKDH